MKYINIIFGIFIIICSQLLFDIIEAFNIGVIIVIASLVMVVLNIREFLRLRKNNNKKEAIIYGYEVLICIILAVLGLVVVYYSVIWN